MWKKLAILSIVANILFALGVSYIVYTKGGVQFLTNFITAQFASAETGNGFEPYFNTKLTVFKEIEGEVVMLGDSLTDNNEWAASFSDLSIVNQGIGSDTTEGVLYRLDLATKSKPEKIFLMIGVNDLVYETPINTIKDNYSEIIKGIKEKSPETELIIQSILPVNSKTSILRVSNEDIKKLNQEIMSLADENNLTYIDLHSLYANKNGELEEKWADDGVHLSGEAYKIWESKISKYLK